MTPDIVKYIDKAKPSPEDHAEILRNPHAFFSKPKNVPVEFRTQVYLYDDWIPGVYQDKLLTDLQSCLYS